MVSLCIKLVFLLLFVGQFVNKFHINLSAKISGVSILMIYRIKFFENVFLNMYLVLQFATNSWKYTLWKFVKLQSNKSFYSTTSNTLKISKLVSLIKGNCNAVWFMTFRGKFSIKSLKIGWRDLCPTVLFAIFTGIFKLLRPRVFVSQDPGVLNYNSTYPIVKEIFYHA